MTPTSVDSSATNLRPALFVALVLVIWAVLAARRPELTYHFAPLIARFVGPAALRTNGPAPATIGWKVGAASAVAVSLASVALHVPGVLDGPTFWNDGPALTEAILFSAIGASVGARVATRERAGILGSFFES